MNRWMWLVGFVVLASAGRANADGFQDTIKFRTGDGYFIEATLGVPLTDDERVAGVVLVHSEERTRSEFDALFEKLLNAGYMVLSYDIRGHGNSTALPDDYDRGKLHSDSEMAPRDLASAIKVVAGLGMVDAQRVAVIGSSLGGSLACAAVTGMGAKTAVALSPKTDDVRNLSGKFDLSLKSVYCVASDGDDGGKFAKWARELAGMATGSKRVEIIEGSSHHGTAMGDVAPKLNDRILAWLAETL